MDFCDLLCLDLDAAERIRRSIEPETLALVAARLKLLGDPTRLTIARALREQELCGCDLGWITGQSDKVISHHLKRLREAGLASSRREGKIVFTALTPDGIASVEAVLEIRA